MYGLVQSEPRITDYVFGGTTNITRVVLQPNHDWTEFLPPKELQNKGFETWACVTFSRNNCLETLQKRLYGQICDHSDRFLAKASGTVVGRGNSLENVAQTARKVGSLSELEYPFAAATVEEYYKELTVELLDDAKEYLQRYEIQYEWLPLRAMMDKDLLWDALKYSPVQVTVFAWEQPVNGVYQKTDKNQNHAVMLFGGEYGKTWKIYDHYEKDIKTLSWDFIFGCGMLHNIIDKTKETMESYEGKLIKSTSSPVIYLVKNGSIHSIPDELVLWSTGRAIADTITVPDEIIKAAHVSEPLGIDKAVKPQLLKEVVGLFANEPNRANELFNKYFL